MALFPCSVCARKFKNRPLIFKHALETGHNVNQCCGVCLRWFDSEKSLAAHAKSSVHVKEVVQPSKPASTSATTSEEISTDASPAVQLKVGDVTYTCLAHQQQDAVLNQLSTSCHPAESLEKEGYILDVGKGPTTKMKRPRPSLADFQQTPPTESAVTKRRAVVIGCEAAETADGSDELISLCAIDFLTGETLVDSFVTPSQPITKWLTKIHGIDAAVIIEAVKHQKALHGWASAREVLWKYIDENTILIGHKLLLDFETLRLIHTRVVVSAILATEAVFNNKTHTKNKKPSRQWGLQELRETFLRVKIRGDEICNNMEDVRASREVVLQYLLKPVEFKKWADKAREDIRRLKAGGKNLKKGPKRKAKPKKTFFRGARQSFPIFEIFGECEGFFQ